MIKVRFFVARLIDKYTNYCWAELVSWVYGNQKLKYCKGKCKAPCYCGKFREDFKNE